MSAGWIIEQDHVMGEDEGVVGPSTYQGATDAQTLPIPFKMYDDDRELHYTGRMNEAALDAFEEFDPLTCFGMPNTGCTILTIKVGNRWEVV